MATESWRAGVPEDSAVDLEILLGTGIGSAREQVEQNGGFIPFALVVETDGEVRLLAVAPEAVGPDFVHDPDAADEEPRDGDYDANAVIADLTELLRQNRHDFRAAALVCDITLVEEGVDAIHVASEHQDGSVFAALLPYWPNAAEARWEFGELAADNNYPVVWVD